MTAYDVAKAVITINADESMHYLLSVKRDPGSNAEGKLEFLGGRFERHEQPHQALLRELQEEEQTGYLSEIAAHRAGLFFKKEILGARHFLFPLKLSFAEWQQLQYHPEESFGYELIPAANLAPCKKTLTTKTNGILRELKQPLLHPW